MKRNSLSMLSLLNIPVLFIRKALPVCYDAWKWQVQTTWVETVATAPGNIGKTETKKMGNEKNCSSQHDNLYQT